MLEFHTKDNNITGSRSRKIVHSPCQCIASRCIEGSRSVLCPFGIAGTDNDAASCLGPAQCQASAQFSGTANDTNGLHVR
jgi:hypothetical protein